MTSSPNSDRPLTTWGPFCRLKWARLATGTTMLGIAALSAPAAAASIDKMLNATPLVLKDGRIAEVSVHTIPFPGEEVAPASATKAKLDAFTQAIATDCFLTAQVIGHVDKSETSGRETADIHRLARARADTIQASLIENGLPAASIASVWDWRFMVQQARVTLWVFRLTAGEDCEDAPLGTRAGDQVAAVTAAEQPERTVTPSNSRVSKAGGVDNGNAQPASTVHRAIPAVKRNSDEVIAAIPATPSTSKGGSVAATKAKTSGATRTAALIPSAAADPKGSVKIVGDGALEVVFATNSSYFPEGAGDQLRAFMGTLDKDKSYILRIQTSVDAAGNVSGASSDNEAARYNAWLAERRFKRVEAWLLKNSGDLDLTLEPSLLENDGSRRVRVEPNPLG